MNPRHKLVCATAALILVVASGCSRSRRIDPAPASTPPNASTTVAPPGTVELAFGPVEANGTPPPGDDVLARVQEALNRYVALAIVAPLRSGDPAPDLSPVFSPAALERVSGPDRSAMVEEGLPAASRSITADSASATLTSVAGPDGATGLVAARLDLRLHAVGPGVDADIVREGELILVPDGDGWKIDAFQIRTTRESRP